MSDIDFKCEVIQKLSYLEEIQKQNKNKIQTELQYFKNRCTVLSCIIYCFGILGAVKIVSLFF